VNREEAIGHVLWLCSSRQMEFCINAEERRESDEETAAALAALGVTPEELEAAR
jgi:hypothetical protein